MAQGNTFRSLRRLANLLKSKVAQGPVLVVLCGPSHAGKSTFGRRMGTSFSVISTDAIRREFKCHFEKEEAGQRVWRVFEDTKRHAFKLGRHVILDACHMTEGARRHAIQDVPESYTRICVIFDVPWAETRARCLRDGRLPLVEVRRMWRAFRRGRPTIQALRRAGFDDVYMLRSSRRQS